MFIDYRPTDLFKHSPTVYS